jgi:hypothetical protein
MYTREPIAASAREYNHVLAPCRSGRSAASCRACGRYWHVKYVHLRWHLALLASVSYAVSDWVWDAILLLRVQEVLVGCAVMAISCWRAAIACDNERVRSMSNSDICLIRA